jgi:hypothetical protein
MDQIEKSTNLNSILVPIEIIVQKGAGIKMKHPDYTWLDIRLSYRLLLIFQILDLLPRDGKTKTITPI